MLKRSFRAFDENYIKIQLRLYFARVILTLFAVLKAPLPEVTGRGWLQVIIMRLVIALIALSYYTLLVTSPAIWLHMIGAAPAAMLRFSVLRVVVKFAVILVSCIKEISAQMRNILMGKRPFQSGSYSLGNLFSFSVVPYRLYPVSCCLLE